jgi:mono/diheme cytochrome c family protein
MVAGFCSGVSAQEIGDAAAGQHLAETWCSTCHVVSPAQQRAACTGAPDLAAIASLKSTIPLSLRALLLTPHDRMPDLHLSNVEIDDLTAYILGLR